MSFPAMPQSKNKAMNSMEPSVTPFPTPRNNPPV